MNENPEFLTTQLITYIGNKRALIGDIEEQILKIQQQLGKKKLVCLDMFSGSGIVARMMKKYSSLLIANDLENYSTALNSCYLSNRSSFNEQEFNSIRDEIMAHYKKSKHRGIITKNYAPLKTNSIAEGERVFYTHENALRIDTFRRQIEKIPDESMRKYFIAPLITEASIHVNTSGIFKGFYKDRKTGLGCFGGTGRNALSRIMGNVEMKTPVLSNFESDLQLFQKDAVVLSQELSGIDVAYLDPPYNQHPYGSNYFMLNLIVENRIPDVKISRVSGIPSNWNRSIFNKRHFALEELEKIVAALDTKFFIISYNSEGFISFGEMTGMLEKYGDVETVEIPYNTFRGSRNLHARSIHVSEYLFVLKKNQVQSLSS